MQDGRTGRTQERRDAVKGGCRTAGSVKGGCRTGGSGNGGMKDEQKYRKGGIQERRMHAVKEEFRREGCRKGGIQERRMQERRDSGEKDA